MATANDWELGRMYFKGLNTAGNAQFTQPGPPFSTVYPQQPQGAPWPDYPVPGLFYEFGGWNIPSCGHYIVQPKVIREYDYDNNVSVALVTCAVCSLIQYAISPYEDWLNPIDRAIIVI